MPKWNNELLLSTDSLAWYGLDLIFEMAKKAWFDGIDLATWKNFDAWNIDYVKKISDENELPVRVIQTSPKINAKELNLALDLCEATGADTICINPPKLMEFGAYNFINDNLDEYKKQNPNINFSIINPEDSNLLALPIPKYRFSNIVEIIKKYGCYLWLDVSNFDEEALEIELTRKLSQFIPYISVVYLSDKTKLGKGHVLPWEWVLKLTKLLKNLKKNKYSRYFSLKVEIEKVDLADNEKVMIMLKKSKEYYKEHFQDIDVTK